MEKNRMSLWLSLKLLLGLEPGGGPAAHRLRNLPALFRSAGVLLGARVGSLLGAVSFVGTVSARVCRFLVYTPGIGLVFGMRWNGEAWVPVRWLDLGLISARLITDAGVAFLVDDWDNDAQNITTMNFHDSGTGTTAEAVGDTDLVTPAGPTTRATGTKSQPAANQLRSIGTINYTGSLAITEHGVFSQATRGGASVLWDRSVFAAINVVSGDAIEFTYTCTVSSGG